MLTHRGFSSWISINNEMVSEYLKAVDEKRNMVSCWIPGELGKEFTVHWQDHGSEHDTATYISLDGFKVPGRFLFGEGVAWRQGIRTSQNTERPFTFRTVEVDTVPMGEVKANEIGTISVHIKKVIRTVGQPANPVPMIPEVQGRRRAGDVAIGYGDQRTTFLQHNLTWKVKGADDDSDHPKDWVTFVFRYRTREFLQAQGIMPEGSPEPVLPRSRVPSRRVVSNSSATNASSGHPSPTTSPYPSPVALAEKAGKPRIQDNQYRMPPASPNSNRGSRASGELRRSSWKTRKITPRLDALPGEGLMGYENLPDEDEIDNLSDMDED